jgi:hypothetical protein
VVGWPVALGSPADAAATAGAPAAAVIPCLVDSARHAPHWRQYEDTTRVTEADLEAIPQAETRRAFVAREVTPQLASTEVVPVYVHVIKGKHRGERVTAGPRKVARVLSILNDAFAGNQSARSTATRYEFRLQRIDYTRRDGWYHAFLNGPRDTRMKRALHRGDAGSLNLYINGGGPKEFPVLGWARFPWQYASKPRLDHVSVNKAALPGGRAYGYNLGDTSVHEVGHWLGLFHTFEGGCETGDQVPDTAPEAEPSYYCETRDTCTADLLMDPVNNFMDYSLDTCMNMFTDGQVRRMDAAFEKWRQ